MIDSPWKVLKNFLYTFFPSFSTFFDLFILSKFSFLPGNVFLSLFTLYLLRYLFVTLPEHKKNDKQEKKVRSRNRRRSRKLQLGMRNVSKVETSVGLVFLFACKLTIQFILKYELWKCIEMKSNSKASIEKTQTWVKGCPRDYLSFAYNKSVGLNCKFNKFMSRSVLYK